LTIVSAILLWKPLKNYKSPNESKPFTDMEGQKAVVIGTLEPGKHGQAKWSGTVMKAKLDESATSSIAEGKEAVIVRVEGNILILK
jgi:membrane protein implicated in regulation of membrane protease activity